MNTFYIAATDRMSWGRGITEWEAIAHALSHGGIGTKTLVMFEINCPDGSLETDVRVNEMGSIAAPKGSEIKQTSQIINVFTLNEKFITYKDMVQELLYPDEEIG